MWLLICRLLRLTNQSTYYTLHAIRLTLIDVSCFHYSYRFVKLRRRTSTFHNVAILIPGYLTESHPQCKVLMVMGDWWFGFVQLLHSKPFVPWFDANVFTAVMFVWEIGVGDLYEFGSHNQPATIYIWWRFVFCKYAYEMLLKWQNKTVFFFCGGEAFFVVFSICGDLRILIELKILIWKKFWLN